VLYNGIGFFVNGGKLLICQFFQSLIFHYHYQITGFHFHQAVLRKIRIKYGYVVFILSHFRKGVAFHFNDRVVVKKTPHSSSDARGVPFIN